MRQDGMACKDAQAALSAAILAAQEPRRRQRLHEVRFGQYATVENGWWWELTFMEQVGNTSSLGWEDEPIARIDRIVRRWQEDIAKYPQSPGDQETCDGGC